jgi:hypothetical protein
MYIFTRSLTWATDGVGGQCHVQAALRPGKTLYLSYRRLGLPQGGSRRVRKILAPSGFDPRTIQPVVSPCTGCTILAHVAMIHDEKLHHQIPGTVVLITALVDEL